MSFIAWILLGAIAGFVANKLYSGAGNGLIMNLILGVIGAFVGGFLFSLIGAAPVTGFNFYSLFVAVVGAVVVLWGYNAFNSRRTLR